MKRSDKNRPTSRVEKTRPRPTSRVVEKTRPKTSAPRVEPRADYWPLLTNRTPADYEDDFDVYIDVDDVVSLLRSIEYSQRQLRSAAEILQRYVEDSPDFAKAWREFNDAGGVSAEDFERFLDDRMRYRPVKRKRHLRVISNNRGKIHRVIVRKGGGGDEAA